MQTILTMHKDQQAAIVLSALIDTGMALSGSFDSYTTCHKGMEKDFYYKGAVIYATLSPKGTHYMLQWYGEGTYYMLQGCRQVDVVCATRVYENVMAPSAACFCTVCWDCHG